MSGETCPPLLVHGTKRVQGIRYSSGLPGVIRKTEKEGEGGGWKAGGRGRNESRREGTGTRGSDDT